MIRITPRIALDEGEVRLAFIRSSGPGGQNVNKVATAVQLRFDVRHSLSLPDDVRERLIRLAGRRVTTEGVLVLDARRFRTQERNREDAIERLVHWVQRAAPPPKRRRPTKPTEASRERRHETKRHRAELKRGRARVVPGPG
jgi:ribosome-associated protein